MFSVLKKYSHRQQQIADVWKIQHNLNTPRLLIETYVNTNGHLEKTDANMVVLDNNTIELHFTSNQTGIAQITGI